MFIGHLAGAEILHTLVPSVPAWIPLVGVGFPDLLWGVTAFAGIEKVRVGESPLQKDIDFVSYPISHSLVLTNLIACVPALAFGYWFGWQAALVFLLASISHWLLDVIVHLRDLPVLGFGRDVKVGLGLWRWSRTAFVVEYLIVVAATLLFEPVGAWLWILVVAAVFHLVNINSFFGFIRPNPIRDARGYAALVWVGFAAMVVAFQGLLQP